MKIRIYKAIDGYWYVGPRVDGIPHGFSSWSSALRFALMRIQVHQESCPDSTGA